MCCRTFCGVPGLYPQNAGSVLVDATVTFLEALPDVLWGRITPVENHRPEEVIPERGPCRRGESCFRFVDAPRCPHPVLVGEARPKLRSGRVCWGPGRPGCGGSPPPPLTRLEAQPTADRTVISENTFLRQQVFFFFHFHGHIFIVTCIRKKSSQHVLPRPP